MTNRTRVFYVWPRELAELIPVPQRRPGRPAWTVLASSYKTGGARAGRSMHAALSAEEAARLQGWPEIAATIQAEAGAGRKGNRLVPRSLIVHYLGNGVPRAMGKFIADQILTLTREPRSSGAPMLRLA